MLFNSTCAIGRRRRLQVFTKSCMSHDSLADRKIYKSQGYPSVETGPLDSTAVAGSHLKKLPIRRRQGFRFPLPLGSVVLSRRSRQVLGRRICYANQESTAETILRLPKRVSGSCQLRGRATCFQDMARR